MEFTAMINTAIARLGMKTIKVTTKPITRTRATVSEVLISLLPNIVSNFLPYLMKSRVDNMDMERR